MTKKATIILPTTLGRAALLPLSVKSVQQQSEGNFELFIIGDGVDQKTRQVILDLQAKDDRIVFFDHAKHERRGEPYRHEALQRAQGEIVCYLCDRDLWYPFHLEKTYAILQEYNFVSNACIWVNPGNYLVHGFPQEPTPKRPGGNNKLSCIGHTLALYNELPDGWRTTPPQIATDSYMWQQFFAHKSIRYFASYTPTVLYYKRNKNYPIEKRQEDMSFGLEILQDRALQDIRDEALKNWVTNRRLEKKVLQGKLQALENQLAIQSQPLWKRLFKR